MNLEKHRQDFNKRWNIASNEFHEEPFKKFKQRILNIFQAITIKESEDFNITYIKGIDHVITQNSTLDFCQYYGIKENLNTPIIDSLRVEENEKEFYRLIEVILSLEIADDFGVFKNKSKRYLIGRVNEAIEMSEVNVTSKSSIHGIILYPKGERKLDEELVNKTLSFLNDESNKHFEEALKAYQNNKAVKSAESLRRSIEEFLRYKLKNKSGLKKNIKNLQKGLKNDSKPEVRNIIFQTFNYLDSYFNENSKHKDGNISESENEFLTYQTGLLLRYIKKAINQGLGK